MHPSAAVAAPASLACESCGRLPHPHRLRLTLAKLVAVFPVELLLHAVVIRYHVPYLLTVALLTVTTTFLVIWVVEPSAMRALGGWLHAPKLRAHERLSAAGHLWRVRVSVDDEPGALERLAHQFAQLEANILDLRVHPIDRAVRDEFVVATPEGVQDRHLMAAALAAGAEDVQIWPTTDLALVDGPTRALALAARVTEEPGELALAVAELLGADVRTEPVTGGTRPALQGSSRPTELRVPTPWTSLLTFSREEPFTPAESARAHRLAEIAEIAELRRPPDAQHLSSGPQVQPATTSDRV